MTNLETLRSRCKLLCNTCYVDKDVGIERLISHLVVPEEEYNPDYDRAIMVCTLDIVAGWVETSRSEGGSHSHGGISTNSSIEAIERNMRRWIKRYNLDPSDYGLTRSEIDNASLRW